MSGDCSSIVRCKLKAQCQIMASDLLRVSCLHEELGALPGGIAIDKCFGS